MMNTTNSTKQTQHTKSSAIYIFIGVFAIVVLLVIAIIMLIQREHRRLHQRIHYSSLISILLFYYKSLIEGNIKINHYTQVYSEMNHIKKESNTTLDGQSIEISNSEPQPNNHPEKLVTFAQ